MDLGLNVKYKARKLLEGNIGENLEDLGFGNDSRYSTKSTIQEIYTI